MVAAPASCPSRCNTNAKRAADVRKLPPEIAVDQLVAVGRVDTGAHAAKQLKDFGARQSKTGPKWTERAAAHRRLSPEMPPQPFDGDI